MSRKRSASCERNIGTPLALFSSVTRAAARIFVFSLTLSASAFAQNADKPIDGEERVKWAIEDTLGVPSLLGGLIGSGWRTLIDQPREYDTHWDGFGQRYGMRLTGVSVSNTMEAGLGAIWGDELQVILRAD